MKPCLLHFPALAAGILAALWLCLGSGEKAALQSAIAMHRARLSLPSQPDHSTALAAENEAGALMKSNAAMLNELRRIEKATRETQNQTAAIQQRIPPSLGSEITESFGRITDMGTELGRYCRLTLPDFEEVEREIQRKGLSADEFNDSIVKGFLKLATWAPEVSAFEDAPHEIATLQSTALREIFNLSESQTRQAKAIIHAHFAAMKTAGLTHSGHDAPDWRERRSASLTELLWKLRPLIPVNAKQTPSLTQIVNFGAGMEVRALPSESGMPEPQIMQSLPIWPAVPWLPPDSANRP